MNPQIYTFVLYFSIFASSAFLVWLAINAKLRWKKLVFYFLGASIPAFMSAIRLGVGTDYWNYVSMTKSLGDMDIHGYIEATGHGVTIGIEPATYMLSVISTSIYGGPQIYFFVMSLIFTVFLTLGLRELKVPYLPLVYFFILLLMFPHSMNGVRQMAAVGLSFYATANLLRTGNIRRYILLSIAGLTLHVSSIVSLLILIMYLTVKRLSLAGKYSTRYTFSALLVISLVVFFGGLAFLLGGEHIPMLGKYVVNSAATATGNGRYMYFVGFYVLILLMLYAKTDLKKVIPYAPFIISFTIMELTFSLLGMWSEYIKRFYLYFSIYSYISIMCIPLILPKKYKKISLLLMLFGGTLLMVYMFFIAGFSNVDTYKASIDPNVSELRNEK